MATSSDPSLCIEYRAMHLATTNKPDEMIITKDVMYNFQP
jgi:hypothetical protein